MRNSSQEFVNILCENNLKEACWKLLDDINARYPEKNPLEWKCPHIRKIANIIGYKRERKK